MISLNEIIVLHEQQRTDKTQYISFYRNLSLEEGKWLADQGVQLLPENQRLAEKIFAELACFVPRSLTDIHPFLMQHGIFYPRHLFKYASPAVSKQFINHIEGDLNRNLYLLAWIGDQQVEEHFAQLRKNPPEWRSKLYIPPEDYSYNAGWMLDEYDKRQDLFFEASFRLVKNADQHPLLICPFETLEERCTQCGNKLAILFDFDLMQPELSFLNLNGTRLRLKTCLDCAAYGTMMTNVDLQGTSEMRKDNQPNKYGISIQVYDDYDWSAERVYLGERRRTPYESLSTLDDFQSQIGGHPFWWDDAHYPKCVICQKPMLYIAQIQLSSGGFYYAHLCKDCGVAAVHYQNS